MSYSLPNGNITFNSGEYPTSVKMNNFSENQSDIAEFLDNAIVYYINGVTLDTVVNNTTTVPAANIIRRDTGVAISDISDIIVGQGVVYDSAGTLGAFTSVSGNDVTVMTISSGGGGGSTSSAIRVDFSFVSGSGSWTASGGETLSEIGGAMDNLTEVKGGIESDNTSYGIYHVVSHQWSSSNNTLTLQVTYWDGTAFVPIKITMLTTGASYVALVSLVDTNLLEDGAVTSDKIDCVSFINARFSGSWSTTSTDWADIPISTVEFSKGNKLTVENNGIRIRPGVQYVEVSGYALYTGGVTAGDIINIGITRLRVGSSNMVAHTYLRAGGNWESITIPAVCFSVQEGDLITMPFKNENRSGTQLDTANTRLYVRTVS